MKKWIWLVFLTLAVATVTIISGFWQQPEKPSVMASSQVETPKPQPTVSPRVNDQVNIFPVSSDRLFSHIQNLNFRRYTNRERWRTRTYITKELQKIGWQPKLQNFDRGINIFAERTGSNKDAGAILLGAHYDTVAQSPGSDDNATGIAVILEIARLLGSQTTPRTLQLAFFDKEESGLWGSKAFVAKEANLNNLQGVIVMDMLGYACYTPGCQKYPQGLPVTPPSDKGDFLTIVGDTEHLPLLYAFENSQPKRPLGKPLAERLKSSNTKTSPPPIFALPVPLKGLLIPDTLRSDHAPFWFQGVGAVLITDTGNLRTPHYHQPSDTPTNIQRQFFTGSAQIIANATAKLLNSSDSLGTAVRE
ncbi:MAG: M20/M25/M40 family metallo-hydrolase [Calothrix sp. MO_192.B10]|nr:M20/M25/M40 family metallo-hydrolase [Calothrix sp. MO_192.B10]